MGETSEEELRIKLANKINTEEDILELQRETYGQIIELLKYFCDIKEEYYNIIALWIIGTWKHKQFNTFPYLFFNAMKGSGKSRILRLISVLTHNGKIVNNVSESVLFRTASNSTICIDEFERIGSKEKAALRELINSAYKKGIKVERASKVKKDGCEEYKIEEFEVYCPIAMANVSGMDAMVEDRCITLMLEKSNDKRIINKIEYFEGENFDNITRNLSLIGAVMSSNVVSVDKNIYITTLWNEYVDVSSNDTTTPTTHTTQTTQTTQHLEFFKKIRDTDICGRHLELLFPIMVIARQIGEITLSNTIETSERIVNERNDVEIVENIDVALLDFISNHLEVSSSFYTIKRIKLEFSEFIEDDSIDIRYIGRALKRLDLIIEKRRVSTGRKVRLNFDKAKNKLRMFK